MPAIRLDRDLTATFGSALTVQDENTNVSTAVTQIDFQGSGVAVTSGTGEVVVTIDPTTPVTSKTVDYIAVLADAGSVVRMNKAAAATFTVPPGSSVAFPTGTSILVTQQGAGQVTLTPGAGVTLRSRSGALKTAGQYAAVSIIKVAADEWLVTGDVVV